MDSRIFISLAVALFTGIGLGIQATITSRAGVQIGFFTTGFLVIALGGVLSVVVIVVFRDRLVGFTQLNDGQLILGIFIAGILAILAIVGTAYALPRVSVAAGLAAIILGQMLVAIIVDTGGIGGMQQIPLSFECVLGLILLAIAVWFLAPK